VLPDKLRVRGGGAPPAAHCAQAAEVLGRDAEQDVDHQVEGEVAAVGGDGGRRTRGSGRRGARIQRCHLHPRRRQI
jgi:hypothetical protein